MSHHSHHNSHGSQRSGGSRNPRITVRDDWYDDLGQDSTGDIMSMGAMSDAWDEERRKHDLEPPSAVAYSNFSSDNRSRVGHTLTRANERLGGSQISAPAYQQPYRYPPTIDYNTPPSHRTHASRNSRDLATDFGPSYTRGSAAPSQSAYDFQGIGQGVRPGTPGFYPQPGYGPSPRTQRSALPFLAVPTRGHPDQGAFWRSGAARRPSGGSGSNSSSDYEHNEYGERVARKRGKKRVASSNASYRQERKDRYDGDGRGAGGRGSNYGYAR